MFDEFEECTCLQKFDDNKFVSVEIRPAVQKHMKRDQIQRIERLHAELIEVEPLPSQDWFYSIAIEPDPEQEIRTTEAALQVFRKIDAKTKLTLDQRRKLYEQVVASMMHHHCKSCRSIGVGWSNLPYAAFLVA